MTLGEIRSHLDRLSLRPSRRLGQNFLHDQNVARLIVELAEIRPDDHVLEIGPGLGALTGFIAPRCRALTLIEKDRRLADFLRTRFPAATLIEGDALEEIANLGAPTSLSTVLGNLPYSIASPLIVRLAEADLRPPRMLFTIQLEVAQRLAASPRTHDYGLLTLLVQPFYHVEIVRKIPATVFWPTPEIASAVVRLTRRPEPLLSNPALETRFRDLARRAFQQRRKTLGAIFGPDLPPSANTRRRPEELTIGEWSSLARAPGGETTGNASSPANGGDEWFDVVNDHDEVIGRERRADVHRRDLLHRAIHIFLWNTRGELLLQKRSALKDVAPNTWDSSAAGHLGTGEDYDPAATREVVEELGVSPTLTRARKFDARAELGWEFVWLYEGKSEGPFQFPESEISELRWWSPGEITDAVKARPGEFAPSFRWIWRHVRRKS